MVEHNSFVLCVSRALESPGRMLKPFQKTIFRGNIVRKEAFTERFGEKLALEDQQLG